MAVLEEEVEFSVFEVGPVAAEVAELYTKTDHSPRHPHRILELVEGQVAVVEHLEERLSILCLAVAVEGVAARHDG